MNHPTADQIAYLIGRKIFPGQHINYTGHFLGFRNVGAPDACMGMRRAHEYRAGLARSDHIIGVSTLAGDKAEIFFSAHRRADTRRAHGGFSHCLDYSAACRAPPLAIALAPAAMALTMLW